MDLLLLIPARILTICLRRMMAIFITNSVRLMWPNHTLQRTPRRAFGLFDNVWPAHWPASAESLSLGR